MSPLIFFPGVAARGFGEVVGFHGSRIDDQGAGFGVTAFLNPDATSQAVVQRLPYSFLLPVPEEGMDGLPVGEAVWQVAPLASGPEAAGNGVDHFPFGDAGWPPPMGAPPSL